MSKKFRLEFDGMDEVIARLKKMDGDVKSVAEKALKETHKIVTNEAQKAIRPHKLTGATEASLVKEAKPLWTGTTGVIQVGFDISKGGLPSIFLMFGTPKIKKDQKLYNAFYGTKIKNEVRQIQEDIFYEELRRLE